MVVSLYWLVLPLVKGKPIKSKGSFHHQQQNKKTNWTYKNEILQILLRSTHSREEEEDEEKEKTFGCLLLFVASSWVTI
jgi:hypothetical protein